MSQPYAEEMDVRLVVSYTPYATYSRETSGDIITFTQFEEGYLWSKIQNLLSETRDDAKIINKSDEDSTMPPIIIEEEMDTMCSGDDYDDEPMST